jgi:hypothetical protein
MKAYFLKQAKIYVFALQIKLLSSLPAKVTRYGYPEFKCFSFFYEWYDQKHFWSNNLSANAK